nr:hypothetical protein CFP56_34090 [Quercus suber]
MKHYFKPAFMVNQLMLIFRVFHCECSIDPKDYLCNGAIYWSARKYVKPSFIYFDLAEEIFHELLWPESVLYCIRDGSSGKQFYTSGLRESGTFGEHLSIYVHRQISQKLVRSAMGDEGILD